MFCWLCLISLFDSVAHGLCLVSPIEVSGIYSDTLYMPWRAATMALEANWVSGDNIERRYLTPAYIEVERDQGCCQAMHRDNLNLCQHRVAVLTLAYTDSERTRLA